MGQGQGHRPLLHQGLKGGEEGEAGEMGGTEARDWPSQADLAAAAAPSALCWARTSTLHGPGLVTGGTAPGALEGTVSGGCGGLSDRC